MTLFLKHIFTIYSVLLRSYTLLYFTSTYRLFQLTDFAIYAFHKNGDGYNHLQP